MMSSKQSRILLADDHTMVREALGRLLAAEESLEVVGQASNGKELLDLVAAESPDVVILDYAMPGSEAETLIPEILEISAATRILVLTFHENVQYALRVTKAGAHGFVIKSAASHELLAGIAAVAAGKTYISPQIASELVDLAGTSPRDRSGIEALSQREFDVLKLLSTGASLKECAKQLDISVSAVSTYRSRLLEKLELKTTADLIRFAIDQRIAE